MTRPLFALLALLVAVPAWAQQPVAVASWGATPTPVTETTPVPMCLSNKTACFTNFGTVPEFDLAVTGTVNVPGYAIAIEGATGPVAVGTATPLPVIVSSSSIVPAVGNVNAGATDTGAPIKVGGIAYVTGLPTSVTNAQRVNAFFDKSGRAVVTNSPREFRAAGTRVSLTATTTETTVVAGAANTFHDLVAATCTNESSTEVRIDWRDTTAGTVRFSMDLAPDGGGSNLYWGPDGYPQGAVNTNWTIQASASVSSVYCTALAKKDL
jgi:hypothetical protein